MVDVALNVVTVLQVFADIRDVVECIRDNYQQARRLSDRVAAIEPTVLAAQHGEKKLSSDSLRQLFKTLKNVKIFLMKYKGMTKLTRVWRRRSNSATFEDFKDDLKAWVALLSLDIVVDVWSEEQDMSDRLEDITTLTIDMKREERNNTHDRAEFARALKVSTEGDPIFLRRRSD